jgi:hypothetical protein
MCKGECLETLSLPFAGCIDRMDFGHCKACSGVSGPRPVLSWALTGTGFIDRSPERSKKGVPKNVRFLPHLAAGSRVASFPHDCNPELPSRKTKRHQTLKRSIDEQLNSRH